MTQCGTLLAQGATNVEVYRVQTENFMKSMNTLGFALLSSMVFGLTGCGGGSNGQNAVNPYANPYGPYYNQQTSQPFTCQAGTIQLRDSAGRPRCYLTSDLAQACAQAGGTMSQGATCRKERRVPVRTARWKLRNRSGDYPVSIPLQINLFPGESVKINGSVEDLSGDDLEYSAQLLQNGAVVGSSTNNNVVYGEDEGNFSISAVAMQQSYDPAYAQQYSQQYPQPQYSPQYNPQYPQGQYGYGQQYGNTYGNIGYSAGIQLNTGMSQGYTLEMLFRGFICVTLRSATAVSCEDGHGNSFACQ